MTDSGEVAASGSEPLGSLCFINRFYYPDHSATSQMLTDLAVGLSAKGWQVSVICSQQLYDDPSANQPSHDMTDNVLITRVTTTRFGRSSLLGRLIDFLSFYATSFWAIRRAAGDHDLIIAKTDPPLISAIARLAVFGRPAETANWLQDLYPEVAAVLGVRGIGVIKPALLAIRDWSLKKARFNAVIGNLMATRLKERGVSTDRIAVIPNWSDDVAVTADPAGAAALRSQWGFDPAWFILGYSGNLGQAHDIETILGAARLTADDPRIRYLFVGGGKQSADLKARANAEGLTSFLFQPYQPRAKLAASLSVADAHWMSLRPELEGLIVPSKFYGIAAAGRPIIAIADAAGEVADLVKAAQCGAVIAPGDAAGLANIVRKLAADPIHAQSLGASARAWLDACNSKELMIERWHQTLLAAMGNSLVASTSLG